MIKSSRQKEDQLLGQIGALIGCLEGNVLFRDELKTWLLVEERIQKGEAGPFEIAQLTKRVEDTWAIFERRKGDRRK